jgi:RimJ/RimL family protein N-acetyltransferase
MLGTDMAEAKEYTTTPPRGRPAIVLEPMGPRHLGAIADLVSDPEVLRFTRVPDHPDPDFAQRWIERYVAGRRDGSCEGFAAVGAGGAFLGLALAPHIDREAREAELGYIVATAARGRGVATAILAALTEWAFAEADVLRAYLMIDVANGASERVARRCGYAHEGVLRSVHVKADRRADMGLWSRLPSDPPATA